MSAPCVCAAFLIFGNSVFSHFVTSDGSRSSAWYNGLCGVMPSCASRRPTEFAASRIPYLSLISFATIARVHNANAKFLLRRFLLRPRVVAPLHLLAVELRRPPRQWLGFQCAPAATTILSQPIVNRGSVETERLADNFRALPRLNRHDRPSPHVFENVVT